MGPTKRRHRPWPTLWPVRPSQPRANNPTQTALRRIPASASRKLANPSSRPPRPASPSSPRNAKRLASVRRAAHARATRTAAAAGAPRPSPRLSPPPLPPGPPTSTDAGPPSPSPPAPLPLPPALPLSPLNERRRRGSVTRPPDPGRGSLSCRDRLRCSILRRAGGGGACPSALSVDTSPRTYPGHDDDFRQRFVPCLYM